MPHDKNNRMIKVGDPVIAKGKVTEVYEGEDFCNMTVRLDASEDFPLDQEHMRTVTTNTHLFEITEG